MLPFFPLTPLPRSVQLRAAQSGGGFWPFGVIRPVLDKKKVFLCNLAIYLAILVSTKAILVTILRLSLT
jgi:hypothetical protein